MMKSIKLYYGYLTLLVVIACLFGYIAISNRTVTSMYLDGDVQIRYSVTTAFLPGEKVEYGWDVSNIRGVYFAEQGVIGKDSRIQEASICHPVSLDVILQDDRELTLTFKPNIRLFDPIFWSLILLSIILILQVYRQRRVIAEGNTLTINQQMTNFVITIIVVCLSTSFILPILTFYYQRMSC